MKKIFAIALAVVMVLSIASVAGALWEPTPADPASEFRVQVSAEKYALETGTYGYKYVATETITAANGADVYYVVKLVIPSNPNAEEKNAKVTVSFDGIQGANVSTYVGTLMEANKMATGTYYYNGNTGHWVPAARFAADPADVVVQAGCFDTSAANIKIEATSQRNLEARFTWGDYIIGYHGNEIGFVDAYDTSTWIKLNIASNGKASYKAGSGNTYTFESELFDALGFTAADLNSGKVYMTETNLRNVFGYSYKVTDSVNWTATSHPIIVDPIVGIPKTGDNASVIGFAMIMVAVVAAAVAVRKVNA